jgi:hypothetical protein
MGKLVWLASYPKSGNTWLRAFLHNYILQPEQPYGINMLGDLSVSESIAAFFNKHDSRPASTFSTRDVQRIRPLVHADFTCFHPDLVFVKTHNAALSFHEIPLCTPAVTAGAIVIVRDPRDVAISFSHFSGLPVDDVISFMGNARAANRGTDAQVFEFLSSWSKHTASWIQTEKRIILRYEDLLAEPQKSFGRIIKFLGEDAPAEKLRRAIRFSSFENLSAQEAEQGYTAAGPNAASKFFRTGHAGQWQTALTPAQTKRIEADHATIMQKFGYLK